MKTRYKITLVAVCAYFGVFLGPVIASNVYCDFVSQEICTSRITGVNLPPFNMIPLTIPSDSECFFENADGVMAPCYAETGYFEWPFPPRMEEHLERNCDEQCTDVGNLPPCTSDRTACFNQNANLCDPFGWECETTEKIIAKYGHILH
jgi:hypothetical protein